MAKDFRKIYDAHIAEYQKCNGNYMRMLPDPLTWSSITYSEMKKEFAESLKFFRSRGYSEGDSASFARGSASFSMVEDLMSDVIYYLYCIDNSIPTSIKWFKEYMLSKYIEKFHTNQLIREMPEEDKKAFDADLNRLLASEDKIIDIVSEEIPSEEFEEFINIDWYDHNHFSFDNCRFIESNKEYLKRMKDALSDTAYKMMTEYRREPFVSPDDYERVFLKPRGFRMTEEIRRFIELYDNRIFAWRIKSTDTFRGYNICLYDIWTDGSNYYIPVFFELVAGDWGPFIRCDGKIYDSGGRKLADTAEEFFEQEAVAYKHDMDLKERKREIADKYCIPEIRKLYHAD